MRSKARCVNNPLLRQRKNRYLPWSMFQPEDGAGQSRSGMRSAHNAFAPCASISLHVVDSVSLSLLMTGRRARRSSEASPTRRSFEAGNPDVSENRDDERRIGRIGLPQSAWGKMSPCPGLNRQCPLSNRRPGKRWSPARGNFCSRVDFPRGNRTRENLAQISLVGTTTSFTLKPSNPSAMRSSGSTGALEPSFLIEKSTFEQSTRSLARP